MMRKLQQSWGPLLLLALSLIGAGIATYLTLVHYENVPLLCSTSGLIDCSRVLSSTYSVVPGTKVPVSAAGLLWCGVSAAVGIVGMRVLQGYMGRGIQVVQFAWWIRCLL